VYSIIGYPTDYSSLAVYPFKVAKNATIEMHNVLILGGGGHGLSTLNLILDEGKFEVEGFLDDVTQTGTRIIDDYLVLGKFSDLTSRIGEFDYLAIGFGEPVAKRSEIFETCSENNMYSFPSFIHPNSHIDRNVSIAAGTQVHVGSVIRVGTKIKSNVIVNTNVTIDHDCVIDSHAVISPGVLLCGRVRVGRQSFVGAGSVVLPGINIGNMSLVGAGSLVTSDVPDSMMCVGNPSRISPLSIKAKKILGMEK
jgi:acetyltransferase EpsM